MVCVDMGCRWGDTRWQAREERYESLLGTLIAEISLIQQHIVCVSYTGFLSWQLIFLSPASVFFARFRCFSYPMNTYSVHNEAKIKSGFSPSRLREIYEEKEKLKWKRVFFCSRRNIKIIFFSCSSSLSAAAGAKRDSSNRKERKKERERTFFSTKNSPI